MLKFVALHLRNVLFFKKVSVRLDQHPLTFILGRNWNAGGSTNAAGKSLLFSQIPELLFGSPIVGVKKDRLQNGTVALDLVRDDVRYRIIRTLTKSKEKLQILREDKDMEFRELAEARKFIVENLLGCSSEEFETRIYLDVQVPHPLIRGDTAQRKKFFTEFFRLNTHEGMLSLIRHEMRLAQQAKDQIIAYKETYTDLKKKLSTYPKTSVEMIQSKEQELKELASTVEKLRSVTAWEERIAEMSGSDKYRARSLIKPFTHARLKEKISQLEAKVERYEQQAESLEEYKAAKAFALSLKKQLNEARSILKDDIPVVNPQLKEKVISRVERLGSRLFEINQQLTGISKEIAALDKEDAPKICDKCGQPWPHKREENVDKKRARLKLEIKELKEQHRELEISLEKRTKKRDSLIRKEEARFQQEKLVTNLTTKWEQAKASVVSAQGKIQEEDMVDEDSIRDTRKFLATLTNNRSAIKALMEYEALPEKLKAKARKLDSYVASHLKAVEELAAMKHHSQERSSLKEQLTQLRDKIEKAERVAADADSLTLLAQAYSKKGMPTLMIKTICSRLEDVVNKYASYIFPEDYSFHFQLDTQFSITVTRKYQGKEVTSDVRKLSGAESRLFSILLLIGLLTFIPDSRRTNLLILDEPDASMGQETVELLLGFLKVLNKIVPNIVVITPRNYDPGEEAHLLTVVKKGTESKLVAGRA